MSQAILPAVLGLDCLLVLLHEVPQVVLPFSLVHIRFQTEIIRVKSTKSCQLLEGIERDQFLGKMRVYLCMINIRYIF